MAEILTANELVSGATVYLTATGEWVEDIDRARLFGADEADARDQLIAEARTNNRLIGIEIEKAEQEGDRIVAERLRERIRSEGPTSPRQAPQTLGDDGNVPL